MPQVLVQTQNLAWAAIGPENYGGRTRALALDVRDEDIVLAGGVSEECGVPQTLEPIGLKEPRTTRFKSVTAITQDIRTGREDTWYYGTGELVGNSSRAPGAPFRGDGIFKSTDNGIS